MKKLTVRRLEDIRTASVINSACAPDSEPPAA